MKTVLLCCCLLFSTGAFSQGNEPAAQYVDQPAEFPGGSTALKKWMSENMTYPVFGQEELTGNAKMSFVVEKDGKLSNVRVYSSNPEFSRYLGGLVLSMPKWTPAILNGQPVPSTIQLPVTICF